MSHPEHALEIPEQLELPLDLGQNQDQLDLFDLLSIQTTTD
jgi:hypothetical protein